MARLLLPPLSQAAEAYVVSIIGHPVTECDPALLAAEQLESLHLVLEAEVEFLREQIGAKTPAPVGGETAAGTLRALDDAVAEIVRLLAVCRR
ncbi:MAG: hypothetical protein Q8N18_18440 [Opitutaceae bacterium]|nr:hypothetical protein [Opitutaceae bacterium]